MKNNHFYYCDIFITHKYDGIYDKCLKNFTSIYKNIKLHYKFLKKETVYIYHKDNYSFNLNSNSTILHRNSTFINLNHGIYTILIKLNEDFNVSCNNFTSYDYDSVDINNYIIYTHDNFKIYIDIKNKSIKILCDLVNQNNHIIDKLSTLLNTIITIPIKPIKK